MKNSNKLSLNINKDEDNINYFLYCFAEMSNKPSRVNFMGYFEPQKFENYLESLNPVRISCSVDIIPTEDVSLINRKNFIQLENAIYLVYTHIDEIHDESLISELCILYDISKETRVKQILEEIQKFLISSNEQESILTETNLKVLGIGPNGFEFENLNINKDFEDIEYFYEEDVLKKVKKVTKLINSQQKGLTIICGERGCGKTNLLSYISTKLDKNAIFIPCNLIENSINNPEFKKLLSENKDSVLILDDVELYFSEMYSKSTFFTNNLLQLIEGIHSDLFNINIIVSLNCEIIDIDKKLTESNTLLDLIEVSKISVDKAKELCEFLDKKLEIVQDVRIIDILKGKKSKINSNELGFK